MSNQENTNPTPQPERGTEELKARDDALFESLSRSKKRRRRKVLTTVLALVVIAAIVLTATVSILQRRVRNKFALSDEDVLSHAVETGTISTLVSGTGILSNVDAETVTVPAGVELTEILVENGDTVTQGQLLATADMATVRSAMSSLQDKIEDLDDAIYDADGDKASTSVTAGVPGRLKVLYGEEGDSVSSLMVEHGALAVLSLDGYMAVDLETDAVSQGDSLTVTLPDGTVHTGSVESYIDGVATILITDDGPENGAEVSVSTNGGTVLGKGELYVHSPLLITGYAGVIRTVHVQENVELNKNSYIYTLKDTEYSANYDTLLRQRRESEETLLELLNIQMAGGVTAGESGSIFNVADLEVTKAVTDLLTLSPDVHMSVTINVDESDILSLKLDQQASVSVSSVTEDVLTGTVTAIDKTASDGAYTAEVTLDKVPGMLPGMTADVDIKIQGVENALLVPADAVHYTSTGAYVFTAYDTQTQQYAGRRDVVTGLSNDDYVEITSGLSLGDTVYYTESTSLYDVFSAMSSMGMGGNAGGRNQMPQGGMSQGGMPQGMPGRSG